MIASADEMRSGLPYSVSHGGTRGAATGGGRVFARACVEWLHGREVAAVAADTMLVEVMPWEDPSLVLPLHMLCIRDMGLTLGEMFDLDALAADCARDGVWEFLFSAPPLKVVGAVGSPLNPLAVK